MLRCSKCSAPDVSCTSCLTTLKRFPDHTCPLILPPTHLTSHLNNKIHQTIINKHHSTTSHPSPLTLLTTTPLPPPPLSNAPLAGDGLVFWHLPDVGRRIREAAEPAEGAGEEEEGGEPQNDLEDQPGPQETADPSRADQEVCASFTSHLHSIYILHHLPPHTTPLFSTAIILYIIYNISHIMFHHHHQTTNHYQLTI